MKTIARKTISMILLFCLILSAAALATSDKQDIGGFDPSTNWTGTYRGIQLSLPSYFDVAENQENRVTLYTKGMSAGGYSAALILMGVIRQGWTESEFYQMQNAVLDKILSNYSDVEGVRSGKPDLMVAGYPTANWSFRYNDSGITWYSNVCLVYNADTRETLFIQLIQNNAFGFTFEGDFSRILTSATAVARASSSNTAPAQQQASAKVKEYCNQHLQNVNRAYELMTTVDLDNMGAVSFLIYAAEIVTLYDDITGFNNASTSGWSRADIDYYNQVRDSVNQEVMRMILSWLDRASVGFLSW